MGMQPSLTAEELARAERADIIAKLSPELRADIERTMRERRRHRRTVAKAGTVPAEPIARAQFVERLRSATEGHAKMHENVRECGPAWYFHRGKIKQYQFAAAMELRFDWEEAQIGAPGAVDPRDAGGGVWRDIGARHLDAVRDLAAAMGAVSRLSGVIAVRWCCEGWPMASIEKAMGWPEERGYGIARMREALDEFAAFYRLTGLRPKM